MGFLLEMVVVEAYGIDSNIESGGSNINGSSRSIGSESGTNFGSGSCIGRSFGNGTISVSTMGTHCWSGNFCY